jgi:uncharacterized membrane protein
VENGSQTYERIAKGLGWFSIGLGAAEVLAPGTVARLIGISDDDRNRNMLRSPLYGMRELAAGAGILTQSNPSGWLWGRVAGDLMDLSSLAAASRSDRNDRTKLGIATVSVLGVTALDIACAQRLSRTETANGAAPGTNVRKSVTVNRSPEEVYSFWRDFQNFPRFMQHLQSVETTEGGRSRWRARGPAGKPVEWQAEMVTDEPNRAISWRSVEGSDVRNSGSVRFQPGPNGNGTIVQVQLDYDPPGGMIGAAAAKLLWKSPDQMLDDDLRRFKQIMETGEVVKSDASIHRGIHPAQPPVLAGQTT